MIESNESIACDYEKLLKGDATTLAYPDFQVRRVESRDSLQRRMLFEVIPV